MGRQHATFTQVAKKRLSKGLKAKLIGPFLDESAFSLLYQILGDFKEFGRQARLPEHRAAL
jgi:hypothetical protein